MLWNAQGNTFLCHLVLSQKVVEMNQTMKMKKLFLWQCNQTFEMETEMEFSGETHGQGKTILVKEILEQTQILEQVKWVCRIVEKKQRQVQVRQTLEVVEKTEVVQEWDKRKQGKQVLNQQQLK